MILQSVISLLTIASMWLLASKNGFGWWLSLASQFLWLAFIVHTQAYGLFPLNIAMWITCLHGITNWNKQERAKQ